MAHFQLAAGAVSKPVQHRTVEEIWYVLSGSGQMWRRQGEREETVDLAPGTCLTIPVGTAFQFRAGDDGPFAAVAITMPPWPDDGEAVFVAGAWPTH
jgi:mannose-6-phosphate isomerase-like protein (cupin superfamily)